MSITKVKILTTPDLIELNKRAVKANRNRALIDEVYELLDPEGTHVVTFSMIHNDVEIRVRMLMKYKDTMEPIEGWLDMSFEDFNKLREVEA